MTVKELSQLYYLNREIEMDMRRLAELERMAEGATSPDSSGMPRTPGISDRVSRYAAEIADLKAIIAAKQLQCILERNRLERYISSIPDSLIRQIFECRFCEGLSWRQTACMVGNGQMAEDSVKKACYRYLARSEAEEKAVPQCPERL